MDTEKMYIVKNRSSGIVVYSLPEKGVRREFQPGEEKKISHSELEALSYAPGGMVLMGDCLLIKDVELLDEMNIHTEPEYFLDEAGVKKLMTEGSLDEFLDCLDFAPSGVIDLIKTFAVALPLTDLNKLNAIKEKTGFNAAEAIRHEQEVKTAENAPAPEVLTRRVKKEETAAPERRTSGSKYTVTK